jgi:membrane protein implicated in regulation of membrane protease activity
MKILINWLVNALVVILVSMLVPGFHVSSFLTALLVALVLGLINITTQANSYYFYAADHYSYTRFVCVYNQCASLDAHCSYCARF